MNQQTGIKLRGHHLICLHFFRGEGYNTKFIENLRKILQKAEDREKIKVHPGADDVCTVCPHLTEGKCFYNEDADSGIKEMDRFALQLLKLEAGENILWQEISIKIPDMFGEWYRRYCRGCSWKWACEEKEGFKKYLVLSDRGKKSAE